MPIRDPFYTGLHLSGFDIVEAGWFEESGITRAADPLLPCTDLSKIRRNLEQARNPVVLLSTGGMAPAHLGHIQMMEAAKIALESRGFDVVGAFLSPGHDEYLRHKGVTTPAQLRVKQTADLIQEWERSSRLDSHWLDADPWEGIHCSRAVNFTSVVARLQAYLKHFLDRDIDVVYVVGGDNARFALTFALHSRCVVVSRPGYDDRWNRYRTDPRIKNAGNRILFCRGGSAQASSEQRSGLYQESSPIGVVLRVDDIPDSSGQYSNQWCSPLVGILNDYFPDVRITSPSVQMARLPISAISLDPLIPAAHNLAISRLYQTGGYVRDSESPFIRRPGASDFKTQTDQIPSGRYTLFDDDSFTGSTFKAATQLLESGRIKICGYQTAMDPGFKGYEVLDARDFMIGGHGTGLVIRTPDGQITRRPYIYPWVDPAIRASIPARFAHEFSTRIRKLNALLELDFRSHPC